MRGRVKVERIEPKGTAQAVAWLFGRRAVVLEKRTLWRKGRPIATGYQKVRG